MRNFVLSAVVGLSVGLCLNQANAATDVNVLSNSKSPRAVASNPTKENPDISQKVLNTIGCYLIRFLDNECHKRAVEEERAKANFESAERWKANNARVVQEEHARAEAKELNDKFRMMAAPKSALPNFCNATVQAVTPTQMKACITASDAWQEKDRQPQLPVVAHITGAVAQQPAPKPNHCANYRDSTGFDMSNKDCEIYTQRIEDAKAMVRENWVEHRSLIEAIEIAFKCDLVEGWSAQSAINTIELIMQNELINAGLFGEPTMSILEVHNEAIRAGEKAAQGGACSRMTPAMRGRLRSMIPALGSMR